MIKVLRHDAELSSEELQADAIKHYDDCYRDYLLAWCNRDNLALHYGYWEDAKPYNQHQALLNKNRIFLYEQAGISRRIECWTPVAASAAAASGWRNSTAIRVTGITISRKQADYAEQHAKRHGVGELVDFQVAIFAPRHLPTKSFDVVWALESSCHALNKADFLREAFRVLRKGRQNSGLRWLFAATAVQRAAVAGGGDLFKRLGCAESLFATGVYGIIGGARLSVHAMPRYYRTDASFC